MPNEEILNIFNVMMKILINSYRENSKYLMSWISKVADGLQSKCHMKRYWMTFSERLMSVYLFNLRYCTNTDTIKNSSLFLFGCFY